MKMGIRKEFVRNVNKLFNMNTLQEKYLKEIRPKLQEQLGIKNVMDVPKLTKIVLNISSKEMLTDRKMVDKILEQLTAIAGQKPTVRRAKKAIAAFKLRENDPIGVSATLRGKRMYEFLTKLVTIVLPRVRDFRGISQTAFDGHGGYTLGMAEQIVFPEIDYDTIDKVRGLEVTLATTGKDTKETKMLLELLGMPFTK